MATAPPTMKSDKERSNSEQEVEHRDALMAR